MSYDSTTEAHWRPYTASISATNTSIITVVVRLCSSDGRAVCITQLGLFPKSSFVLSPTQNRQFFRSCGKWVGEVSLNRLHVASKIKKKKNHQVLCLFLSGRRTQMQQLVFHHRQDDSTCSRLLKPEISPPWKTLEFLWYLFSILWHTHILTLSLEYFLPSHHQVQASQ